MTTYPDLTPTEADVIRAMYMRPEAEGTHVQ